MEINELYVGQTCSLSKRFTTNEVIEFSKLSLDNNPVHLDEEYAKTTIFENCIVHGFLSGSLISAIIGTMLPGNGSIYLNQNLNFRKPVYHNQLITGRVTVLEILLEKSLISLETICINDNNDIVIDGSALVKLI